MPRRTLPSGLAVLVLLPLLAAPARGAERCNGVDDDRDGRVDEDFPALGTPCDGGDPDACAGGLRTCTADGRGLECVNDGALAWFAFDEADGLAVRSSSGRVAAGALHGALRTAPSHRYDEGAGQAAWFDGVDDAIDVPPHPSLDLTRALTVEAWIHPTDPGGAWQVVGGRYTGGGGGWYLAVNAAQGPGLSAWFGVACGWKYSGRTPRTRIWSHVAATYDGATARLYLDGALVHASACPGNGGSLAPTDSPLHIGGLGAYDPTAAPFAGLIDDFVVWGRALTAGELRSRARGGDACDGFDNDCDGLVDETLYLDPTHPDPATGEKGLWARADSPCDGADSDRCAHGTYTCAPGGLTVECRDEAPAWIPEVCDGLDTDCDGVLPAAERDADRDGFMVCEGDCDDRNKVFHPAATERCDGIDTNCDGFVPVAEQDRDGDGHLACVPGRPDTFGTRWQWADCDDTDPRVHRDHPEVCDGIDNDCDGRLDPKDPDHRAPQIQSYEPIGVGAGSPNPAEPDFGPQTYTITFRGRNFVDDVPVTTFDFGTGITVDEVVVYSTTLMTARITVAVVEDLAAAHESGFVGVHTVVVRMGYCRMEVSFDVFSRWGWPCWRLSTAEGLTCW